MAAIPAWALSGKPRAWARRVGITRLAGAIGQAKNRARRREFERSRPTHIELPLRDGVILANTRSPEEYQRALSLKDDQHLLDALARCLRPGDVFWDVGSNVGLYALAMSHHVRSFGHILAFEPEPRALQSLLANIELNQLGLGSANTGVPSTAHPPSNIEVISVALSDRSGTRSFFTANHGADGTHTLVASGDHEPRDLRPDARSGERTIEVRVARGDSLVSSETVKTPNVIKLDVEGAELHALDGMRQTLRSPSLRAVLIEVHAAVMSNAGIPDAPRQIVEALRSAGLTRQTWLDASHLLGEREAQ